MPVFEYSALNKKGRNVTGIVDAEGAAAARQKLRGSGIFPVSVKELQTATSAKSSRGISVPRLFSRIKPGELAITIRQLATLVGAGFPLVKAIDTIRPACKSQSMKKILAQVKDAIVEGSSFSNALAKYPGIFSPVFINMVHAGETSGTLEIVLERVADITEKQQALANRIKTALAYPVFMTLIGTLVLFILLTYIVPKIVTIFSDMKQVLPTPTRIMIGFSQFFESYWYLFGLLAIAGATAFHFLKKSPTGRRAIDRLKMRLPVYGAMTRKLAAARFARTLGSLLENGITMLPALDIVKNIVGNVLISDVIQASAAEVGKGQGLGVFLASTDVFPPLAAQMIQVGEQSGELEQMLSKMAQIFDNEVESSILSMTALLEPVMILVMGVIVGYIVISICLPIFEMNQLIK